jgi:hypothetical protein
LNEERLFLHNLGMDNRASGDPLPKYLAAAYIAASMGITPATALKRMKENDEPAGDYWVRLAETVRRDLSGEPPAGIAN